jgi:Putative prokaryotic signal transducing protein
MSNIDWRVLTTYASGFEADFAMALLEAAEIPAWRDNNDTVGIFGPGFQGATSHGVTIRVPADALDEARAVVNLTDVDPGSDR